MPSFLKNGVALFVIDNKVGSGVLVKAVAVDKSQFDVAIIVGAFVVTSRAARLIRQRNVNIQVAVDDVLLILRRNAVGVPGDCDRHQLYPLLIYSDKSRPTLFL